MSTISSAELTSFVCSNCNQVFASRGSRDYHFKRCKNPILKFANKTVELVADKNNTFHCQCDSVTCRKTYKTVKAFQGHFLPTAQWIETTVDKPV